MKTHRLTIHPDGLITTLGNPLGLPGVVESKRWSTIKPVNPLLRLLFNSVRNCFGDKGRMAEWTRRWRTTWQLHIPSLNYAARCNDRTTLLQLEHEQYFNQQP